MEEEEEDRTIAILAMTAMKVILCSNFLVMVFFLFQKPYVMTNGNGWCSRCTSMSL